MLTWFVYRTRCFLIMYDLLKMATSAKRYHRKIPNSIITNYFISKYISILPLFALLNDPILNKFLRDITVLLREQKQ